MSLVDELNQYFIGPTNLQLFVKLKIGVKRTFVARRVDY